MPSDSLVGTWTSLVSGGGSETSRLDDSGRSATIPGTHELTIPLPGGLPPDPRKPFVLVVANPGTSSAATNPRQTASFRTYVIGIVTHGALINPSWKHGPPWQLQTATILKQQGYDAVIPFNWASESSNPGHAARQGLRLARQVLATASRFPATSSRRSPLHRPQRGSRGQHPGHRGPGESRCRRSSRPVSSKTRCSIPMPPTTMFPARPAPRATCWELLRRVLVTSYQARANDPPVFIPPGVDAAQVFYQHNPASRHGGIYNLWGQVPVPNLSGNPVAYYNLTAAGAIHSGNYGVSLWYRNFVAPTLGDQAPLLQALQLDSDIDQSTVLPQRDFSQRLMHRRGQAPGARAGCERSSAQVLRDRCARAQRSGLTWVRRRIPLVILPGRSHACRREAATGP